MIHFGATAPVDLGDSSTSLSRCVTGAGSLPPRNRVGATYPCIFFHALFLTSQAHEKHPFCAGNHSPMFGFGKKIRVWRLRRNEIPRQYLPPPPLPLLPPPSSLLPPFFRPPTSEQTKITVCGQVWAGVGRCSTSHHEAATPGNRFQPNLFLSHDGPRALFI